ncbi:MAG: prealbumin-like fold domain-containing protein [archaeon]|nr:prealbumin-like fold domain-containing protein [archaeon]
MNFDSKRIFFIIPLFIVLILSIGSVSALDDIDDSDVMSSQELVSEDISEDINSLNAIDSDTDDVSSVALSPRNDSFTALNNLIKNTKTSVLTLDKNYNYYNDTDYSLINGIHINKNLRINGAGHTINGKNLATVFNLNTNGTISFNNLNFVNSNAALLNNSNLNVGFMECSFSNTIDCAVLSLGAKNIIINYCVFDDSGEGINGLGTGRSIMFVSNNDDVLNALGNYWGKNYSTTDEIMDSYSIVRYNGLQYYCISPTLFGDVGTLSLSSSATYHNYSCFNFKVVNSFTKKPVNGVKITLNVNTKVYYATTNSNGVASFKLKLPVGTYTLQASSDMSKILTPTIVGVYKITKFPALIKAPSISAKYKSSKYFKVKVINAKTNKGVSGLKVTVKVYTGKKYKKYALKTNSKGLVSLNTKGLKLGKHKVVISSSNLLYNVKKISYITIKRR